MRQTKNYKDLLQKLLQADDIGGAAILDKEGSIIMSELPAHIDEIDFSTMSAAMTCTADSAAKAINNGRLRRVIAEVSNGGIISLNLENDKILVILANSSTGMDGLMNHVNSALRNFKKGE